MTEPVHIYMAGLGFTRRRDTILPPGSTVHSSSNSPAIAYTFISYLGELTVAVRGPYSIGKASGASGCAYYLRHPNGKES